MTNVFRQEPVWQMGSWVMLLLIMGAVPAMAQPAEPSTEGQDKIAMKDAKSTGSKTRNHLAQATSPYLLQHAENPVDWYEWGKEALEKARREDKPIFLSIGYSACHWCHVMAHESFESEEVAKILNELFVCIKVDREERPDIDEIYMSFTIATKQGGGWPMSVWLMPDGTPFYAATYLSKDALVRTSERFGKLWKEDREKITGNAEGVRKYFTDWARGYEASDGVISRTAMEDAAITLAEHFDREKGGLPSGENKFPPSMALDFMLRVYRITDMQELLDITETTLTNMARGGITDQLGGGIYRYSTDHDWLVPHFEKMLYDQALVSSVYIDAYQITRKPLYAKAASDIFDYVIGDLQSPDGGFYSSRDADSSGLEGAFYIWTYAEVGRILGEEDAKLFRDFYGVTRAGNWFEYRGHAPEGPKNILHVAQSPEAFAAANKLTPEDFTHRLATWRTKLLDVRAQRTPPARDDKILTGWNGLMIASLAKGAVALDEPKYADAAARAADFILTHLRQDGRLLRTHRDGRSKLTAYLTDYAFMVEGLLNLYEATFDRRWLSEAVALTDTLTKHYDDPEGGAFFFTAADADKLMARSRNLFDSSIPSGNSVQVMNLQRLAVLFDRKDYREKALIMLRTMSQKAIDAPGSLNRLLCAVDFHHDKVKEIALIGDEGDAAFKALLRTVFDQYLPNKVVVYAPGEASAQGMPLLKGKTKQNGKATAYVCENYTCRRPVTTPEDLGAVLKGK